MRFFLVIALVFPLMASDEDFFEEDGDEDTQIHHFCSAPTAAPADAIEIKDKPTRGATFNTVIITKTLELLVIQKPETTEAKENQSEVAG